MPPDVQFIIREEAKRHEAATKEDSVARWDRRGVKKTVSAGMEHIELTEELTKVMRTAALTTILPNWVRRAGGSTSTAVRVFNAKDAPIVNVEITNRWTAIEIE